ncbi:MAG: ABC transporter permease [Christensenellaceae bacterium]|nr:ABC transporter permease [Christensenellaceae bacterium]
MELTAKQDLPVITDREARRNGFRALYYKEVRDYFRSLKFIIVLALVTVLGLTGVYGAFNGIRDAISDSGNSATYTLLSLFTEQGASWPSFVWFLMFLGPLVGMALGFDAINGERSRRTLSRLLAQPIHRDAVINGKFWAGVTVLAIMVFALGFFVIGFGIAALGLVPTLEQLLRIVIFLFFTVVYMALFLALSQLFSLLFRHMATSALMGIAVWLFLAIFLGLLANVIAGVLFPVTDTSTVTDVLNNYRCSQFIKRLSPSTLYSEAVVTVLDPNVRTLDVVSFSLQQQNAIVGELPLGQSLLLVWPHLTGLIALAMICFGVSYVVFMRQEVRAD